MSEELKDKIINHLLSYDVLTHSTRFMFFYEKRYYFDKYDEQKWITQEGIAIPLNNFINEGFSDSDVVNIIKYITDMAISYNLNIHFLNDAEFGTLIYLDWIDTENKRGIEMC